MKVKFLSLVQHDRTSHAVGDTADLPGAAAKALIECGAAEAVDASVARADAHAKANAQAAALARAELEAAESRALADADAAEKSAGKPD